MRKQVNKKAKEINDNSILPGALLSRYYYEKSQLLFPGSSFVENYMSFDFISDDYLVSFSGYPTDESQYRLTKIELLTDKYNICGITVGMRNYVAENIILSFEFSKYEECGSIEYCFPGICIKCYNCNEAVEKISVEIETYYLGNFIY